MIERSGRPALRAAAVIILGILTARAFTPDWRISASAAVLFLIVSLVQFFQRRSEAGRIISFSATIIPALFFASAAAFSIDAQFHGNDHITNVRDTSDTLQISCTVIDQPRIVNGKTTMLVSVTGTKNEFDSLRIDGKAYLTVVPDRRKKEVPSPIEYGAQLTFRSIIRSPGRERNPGEFSYRDYLAVERDPRCDHGGWIFQCVGRTGAECESFLRVYHLPVEGIRFPDDPHGDVRG
jgi:hypothetical protein